MLPSITLRNRKSVNELLTDIYRKQGARLIKEKYDAITARV